MDELTPEQVASLATVSGVPILAEDLAQVTNRYNALLRALAPLATLDLPGEPFVAPPLPKKRP